MRCRLKNYLELETKEVANSKAICFIIFFLCCDKMPEEYQTATDGRQPICSVPQTPLGVKCKT